MPVKKKGEHYQFTVRGGPYSEFPIDMLRYDSCWPAHEDGKITHTFHGRFVEEKRAEPAEIELTGLREPTKGRWESFGWKVIEIDGMPQ